MKILVDVMGGDNFLDVPINSVLEYSKINSDIKFTLLGDEKIIKEKLPSNHNFQIINAPEKISSDETGLSVIRKKNSPIVMGLNFLKDENYDAFISAGSTAAILTAATLLIKRLPNIERPGLMTILPSFNDKVTVFIDEGANITLKNKNYHELAILGSVYSKNFLKVKNPKVGLLNIGTEKDKGTEQLKEVHAELLLNKKIKFEGNVESRDILNNDVDVIITDGYSGNLVLKSIEGSLKNILNELKTVLTSTMINKIAALILKPELKKMQKKLDYNEYGGAILLGLEKIVIKAHGSSVEKTFMSAIRQAENIHNSKIIDKIKKQMK